MPLTTTQSARLSKLTLESSRRDREALRVYRPQALQQVFHESLSAERLVRGGKRSGKTICVAAELASAVTGMPIIGSYGPMPRKYPKTDMIVWVIGWDLAHIGQTLHRVLFKPGLFRVVKDEYTGMYRTLNPADPDDMHRRNTYDAEPLIPERFIKPKSWGFHKAAEKVFTTCTIRNDWGEVQIFAFPSTGMQAKQGDPVDLIWIDEDIRFSDHVAEWQDRLPDRKGRLIWSAWPHGSNDALIDMSERAKEQEGDPKSEVSEIVLRFSDNPFIDPNEKVKAVGRMSSEEARRSRDYGEFILDTIAMYDFIPIVHGIHHMDREDALRQIETNDVVDPAAVRFSIDGKFPDHWTRYAAIDPSHVRSACTFFVIPNPTDEEGGRPYGHMLIVEDELVIKKADTKMFTDAFKGKVLGKRYEAFIMDRNVGRQTGVGRGRGQTVMSIYEEEFRSQKVESRTTGNGFIPGTNDVGFRTSKVRNYLNGDGDGKVKLRFLMNKTLLHQREFKTYLKKVSRTEGVNDAPRNPRTHDCMAALEYGVAYIYTMGESAYMDHGVYKREVSPVFDRVRKMLSKRLDDNDTDSYCHIGPGSLT